eukprot:gene24576-biopygen22407
MVLWYGTVWGPKMQNGAEGTRKLEITAPKAPGNWKTRRRSRRDFLGNDSMEPGDFANLAPCPCVGPFAAQAQVPGRVTNQTTLWDPVSGGTNQTTAFWSCPAPGPAPPTCPCKADSHPSLASCRERTQLAEMVSTAREAGARTHAQREERPRTRPTRQDLKKRTRPGRVPGPFLTAWPAQPRHPPRHAGSIPAAHQARAGRGFRGFLLGGLQGAILRLARPPPLRARAPGARMGRMGAERGPASQPRLSADTFLIPSHPCRGDEVRARGIKRSTWFSPPRDCCEPVKKIFGAYGAAPAQSVPMPGPLSESPPPGRWQLAPRPQPPPPPPHPPPPPPHPPPPPPEPRGRGRVPYSQEVVLDTH